MGTWFWEQFGTAWWELDPPRHLWVHTQASLELLAGRAGLALVDVVWDSSYLEIIASEQIGRDIAWREPGSWLRASPADRDADTIARYQAQVAQLNREGQAGRAGFYFRRSDSAASDQRATTGSRRGSLRDPRSAWPPPLADVRSGPRDPRVRGRATTTPAATSAGPATPAEQEPGIQELIRATPRESVHQAFRINLIVPSVSRRFDIRGRPDRDRSLPRRVGGRGSTQDHQRRGARRRRRAVVRGIRGGRHGRRSR